MNKALVRAAFAALLAAPLALGLQAQNAPAPASPPSPAPAQPASPAGAQQTPPIPTFRADINFVRVDVIVSDNKGNPVDNLRQEDFEVTEDGKPQTIQTFKLVNVTDAVVSGVRETPRQVRNVIDEQTEAARDDVRLFAVFLDDYHVRLENSMRAREPIAQFIENQLAPLDMAGIMYPLWSINDVMLNRDRKSVANAIRQFVGRKGDYKPMNLFEERYVHYVSTMEAERIRNEVTMSAIKGLIVRLGGISERRKAIILISEGFTSSLPSQAQDPIASMPRMPGRGGTRGNSRPDPLPGTDPALESRQASQDFFAQSSVLSDLRLVYEMANRFNTAIYAVDPRGLAVFEFDLSRPNISQAKDKAVLDNSMDTLRVLADETDGRAILNSNDLSGGLKQIVRDSSAYYLLGYTTTQNAADGRFHRINVRVKRPNVQVRARKGYAALTAREVERALAPPKAGPPPAVVEALAAIAVRKSLIRSWVGMSPGTNGKTKVSFVWEPMPRTPGVRTEVPARISLIAGGAGSDLYYRGKALAPGRVEFEAPPGPVELEIAVEDAAADVVDRENRKIVVPSLDLGLALNTPVLFRARTAREWQMVSADPNAIPVIEREFRRTDRLLLRVAAQSAGGTPTIGARLLNREGGQMSVLTVTPAPLDGFSHVDVPLAALPTGEYLIEINASEGPEKAATLVAIRMVS